MPVGVAAPPTPGYVGGLQQVWSLACYQACEAVLVGRCKRSGGYQSGQAYCFGHEPLVSTRAGSAAASAGVSSCITRNGTRKPAPAFSRPVGTFFARRSTWNASCAPNRIRSSCPLIPARAAMSPVARPSHCRIKSFHVERKHDLKSGTAPSQDFGVSCNGCGSRSHESDHGIAAFVAAGARLCLYAVSLLIRAARRLTGRVRLVLPQRGSETRGLTGVDS